VIMVLGDNDVSNLVPPTFALHPQGVSSLPSLVMTIMFVLMIGANRTLDANIPLLIVTTAVNEVTKHAIKDVNMRPDNDVCADDSCYYSTGCTGGAYILESSAMQFPHTNSCQTLSYYSQNMHEIKELQAEYMERDWKEYSAPMAFIPGCVKQNIKD